MARAYRAFQLSGKASDNRWFTIFLVRSCRADEREKQFPVSIYLENVPVDQVLRQLGVDVHSMQSSTGICQPTQQIVIC